MEIIKIIFGKNYKFICNDSYASILVPSIELYPDGDNENIDLTIEVQNLSISSEILAQNPSTFQKFESSICYQFYKGRIYWEVNRTTGKILVQLVTLPRKEGILGKIRKFRSMEFATEEEEFQQILHELVLVPSAYFFQNLSVVHSAAFIKDGKATVLAGTGGTGKTSALLSLRNNKNIAFAADDISIISSDGYIHPNLAWPKIYGYNLSTYITKAELLDGRNMVDKFQFNYKVRKNPKKVRRKLKPNVLYQGYASSQTPIQNIFYLFRDDSTEMYISPLEKGKAIQMGIHIMKTEYNKIFHNYLDWDEYNSIALGVQPILNLNKVFENWKRNLNEALENVNIQLLHIPFKMPHEEYLKNVHRYILYK